MLSLVLGAIFFSGIHLGVAGTTWRDRAIAALDEGAYRAAFSIASLAGIVWLMMAFKHAPYAATWGIPEEADRGDTYASRLSPGGDWVDHPEPYLRGPGRAGGARPPDGIVRVTRHPFLTGVALWAVIHLIANGDVASFIFFGALAVTALAGTVSIDAKHAAADRPGEARPPRPRAASVSS